MNCVIENLSERKVQDGIVWFGNRKKTLSVTMMIFLVLGVKVTTALNEEIEATGL